MGILSPEEKAYCRGLEALRNKDFELADSEFRQCGEQYGESRGFSIIAEAAALMVLLRKEKKTKTTIKNRIQELSEYGEETIVCGQGEQEETR